MRNGHHVFGLFGTRNWGTNPAYQRHRQYPSRACWVCHDECQGALCPRGGYDEDKVAIVMDDPDMSECPVILGTPTIYRVMGVIKESEISKLPVPWASSRVSWLMRDVQARLSQVVMNDVANKPNFATQC